MSPFQRIHRGVVSYRLGYSPKRPYPWRWTTPTVLCGFLLLTMIHAAVNVPLSAYDIAQQSTFRPNDTLSPLLLSQMIPQILRHPTEDFSPQILTVGDKIQLNNSAINFTIAEAFDEHDNTQPVPSFSYYNNPFSGGCDVTNMTAILTRDANGTTWRPQLTVAVTFNIPTLFALTWNAPLPDKVGITPSQDNIAELVADLTGVFASLIQPFLLLEEEGRNLSVTSSAFGVPVEP